MSDALSVVLRHYDALNDRDFETYAALLSEDVVATVNGNTIRGRAAMMTYVDGSVGQLPTLRIEVEEVLAESPRLVVTRTRLVNTAQDADASWHFAGSTHQIAQVRDGQITEIVSFYNPHAADRTVSLWRPIRSESARLFDEQASLLALATVVAQGSPESLLFDAVNEAVADVVEADVAMLFRFERDASISLLASRGAPQRRPLDDVLHAVRDTNSPRWLEGGDGLRSTVVVPITIAGTVWGASVAAWRRPDPFEDATEARMASFTDLAAIALAISQDRLELQQNAADQAALRRVAEVAARRAGGGHPRRRGRRGRRARGHRVHDAAALRTRRRHRGGRAPRSPRGCDGRDARARCGRRRDPAGVADRPRRARRSPCRGGGSLAAGCGEPRLLVQRGGADLRRRSVVGRPRRGRRRPAAAGRRGAPDQLRPPRGERDLGGRGASGRP